MRALPRSLAALVVALIIGCGVPGPALAAKPHHPAPAPQTLAQTVAACRWRVRSQFESTFDAYVNPADGVVHYLGTTPAHFRFERCMVEFGRPLVDPATPALPALRPTHLTQDDWPEFRDACVKRNTAAFCSCAWTKMAQRFTRAELEQMASAENYSPLAPINEECSAIAGRTF